MLVFKKLGSILKGRGFHISSCKTLFILLCFTSTLGFSQSTNCDSLQQLLLSSKYAKAKKYIVGTLNKYPNQPDCFFEIALEAYKHAPNLDTVQQLCGIWETVSLNPCKTKAAYVHFLTEAMPQQISSTLCTPLKELFVQCGQRYFNDKTRIAAHGCPNFSCLDLDTLFSPQNKTIQLEEAQKLASIFAQRNCTKARTYLKAHEIILANEPTFNSLYNQAEIYRQMNKWNEAYSYYAKAEKMSGIPQQKSACYLGIAHVLEHQKQYAKAKDFAQLASETDLQNQESFVFLAQLFQKAEQLCDFQTEAERCALNLLIAHMHDKAGNKAESEKFRKQSKVELLQKEGKIILGQKQKLECFIMEEIELKK